ncbi:MAG: hypothetical protein ACM3PX_09575 [Omnitrophica WOR_2 bacterium]|jgi:hypothetical protein
MTLKSIIDTLKIPVYRNWLFFAVAIIWLFASVRVFLTAWEGTLETKTPLFYFIIASFIGSILFTKLVFMKVTSRYIRRIHTMTNERPSLFAMFSVKSYLLIMFMISMGIGFKYSGIVPLKYLSMFLGALGLSLFVSSLQFFREWKLNYLIKV